MATAARTANASPWRKAARDQDREIKRDAVLSTAARLFAENGYHGTSLELVAEALEISRPTVYFYVKNKDEILFECVRIALEMVEAEAQAAMDRGGSAFEQLIAVMRKYAEIITMDFGMCLVRVGDSPLTEESRRKVHKIEASIDKRMRALVQQSVDEGDLAPCDPNMAAFVIAGALNSIARWYRPGGGKSAAEICNEFIGMIVNGLGRRDKPLDFQV